jgi:hypothetical protein
LPKASTVLASLAPWITPTSRNLLRTCHLRNGAAEVLTLLETLFYFILFKKDYFVFVFFYTKETILLVGTWWVGGYHATCENGSTIFF